MFVHRNSSDKSVLKQKIIHPPAFLLAFFLFSHTVRDKMAPSPKPPHSFFKTNVSSRVFITITTASSSHSPSLLQITIRNGPSAFVPMSNRDLCVLIFLRCYYYSFYLFMCLFFVREPKHRQTTAAAFEWSYRGRRHPRSTVAALLSAHTTRVLCTDWLRRQPFETLPPPLIGQKHQPSKDDMRKFTDASAGASKMITA